MARRKGRGKGARQVVRRAGSQPERDLVAAGKAAPDPPAQGMHGLRQDPQLRYTAIAATREVLPQELIVAFVRLTDCCSTLEYQEEHFLERSRHHR